MLAPDLRRLYRAARAVDTLPARAVALSERLDRARTTLAVALAAGPVTLPGYAVALGPDGPTVRRVDVSADQLALWAELSQED